MEEQLATMDTIQIPVMTGPNGATIATMTNGTRFTLCIFMLAVLAFNPFGSLLQVGMSAAAGGGDYMHQHSGGRMLMGDGTGKYGTLLSFLAVDLEVKVSIL